MNKNTEILLCLLLSLLCSSIGCTLNKSANMNKTDKSIFAGTGEPESVVGAATMDDPALEKLLDEAETQWLESFNEGNGDVSGFYLKKAVFFPSEGSLIRGRQAIAAYYRKQRIRHCRFRSITAEARHRAALNLVYEIGYLVAENGTKFKYIVAWREIGDTWARELEAIAKTSEYVVEDASGIERSRQRWIELCRQHDPNVLVKQLYEKNAYYYNRERVLQGTIAIASEYGYMADPGYMLNLAPLSLTFVTSNLAFEIGKCTGTWGGYYLLCWQRGRDGIWRILLDSNE